MRRLLRCWPRDRRQAQAGTTLVELLVSLVIMGLVLVLIVGTFSTGLLDATLAKRNTAAVAVVQYELDRISGEQWGVLPAQYSDCFATENTSAPTPAISGGCPSAYTLRVDVNMTAGNSTTQTWSVAVTSTTNGVTVGKPVQVIKVNR